MEFQSRLSRAYLSDTKGRYGEHEEIVSIPFKPGLPVGRFIYVWTAFGDCSCFNPV